MARKIVQPRELELDLRDAYDSDNEKEKIVRLLRTVRCKLDNLVVTAFDGTLSPRTTGETYGFLGSEILDDGVAQDTNIIHYITASKKPTLAVYDVKFLKMTDIHANWIIKSKKALLAVIRIGY